MDDPALLKAALLDQPLHRRIVGVGIDADIGGKKLAPPGKPQSGRIRRSRLLAKQQAVVYNTENTAKEAGRC